MGKAKKGRRPKAPADIRRHRHYYLSDKDQAVLSEMLNALGLGGKDRTDAQRVGAFLRQAVADWAARGRKEWKEAAGAKVAAAG